MCENFGIIGVFHTTHSTRVKKFKGAHDNDYLLPCSTACYFRLSFLTIKEGCFGKPHLDVFLPDDQTAPNKTEVRLPR